MPSCAGTTETDLVVFPRIRGAMHFTYCVFVSLVPSLLVAQTIVRVPLKSANATLEAEFVVPTSLREIADGRVIVTDGRDQQLYVADFRANTSTVLGRKGKGPGEYSSVGLVFAAGGDTTIMDERSSHRWLLIDGAKIVGTVPPDHPAVRATGARINGLDRLGNVLYRQSQPAPAGSKTYTRADSNWLVFVDRHTGAIDTIGRTRARPLRVETQIDADGRVVSMQTFMTESNAMEEMASLFVDGWLAVVRLDPLRVDWRSPAGQWTSGRPIPVKPEMVRGKPRPVVDVSQVVRQTSDGRLLIRRSLDGSGKTRRYLIINRRGTVDGQLVLSTTEDVLGFGAQSIYLSVKDEDDIVRLRRHPWP